MTAVPSYDAAQLGELLGVLRGVDSVELKLTVPHADQRRVLRSLGFDPLDGQIRQVAFVDTLDLRLSGGGLVVRARRTQGRPGDLTVKLRPMLPDDVPAELRALAGFKVEVDASPQGFTCSCSLTTVLADREVRRLLADDSLVGDLLDGDQRALLAARLPQGLSLADLRVLGPLTLLKAKVRPDGFGRKLVAELWFLPDGSRLLELSTKCTPAEAFQVAAEAKVLLAGHGLDLDAPQETKTRTALAALAAALEKEQG